MSSSSPVFGLESIANFARAARTIQQEFGAVKGVMVFDDSGSALGFVSNFTKFRDTMEDVARRTCQEVEAERTKKYQGAKYVGVVATEQRDPVDGCRVAADTLAKYQRVFDKAGLTIVQWVEIWQDEFRVPEELVLLHDQQEQNNAA